MADLMSSTGLNGYFGNNTAAQQAQEVKQPKNSRVDKNANTLELDDFLLLIVEQMKNQDMSNPMDASEMMNQLVQMSTVEAMTSMVDAVNTMVDASITTYAASLVGKDVTVAETDSDGKLIPIEGTVTGCGLYAGEQIIFVDGKSYKLSSIMAVGKIPSDDESNDNSDDSSVQEA